MTYMLVSLYMQCIANQYDGKVRGKGNIISIHAMKTYRGVEV